MIKSILKVNGNKGKATIKSERDIDGWGNLNIFNAKNFAVFQYVWSVCVASKFENCQLIKLEIS